MLRFAVFILLLALVIYVITRLLSNRASGGPAPTRPRRRTPTPPQRPVGPDDDEDFLRDIERRRRSEGG